MGWNHQLNREIETGAHEKVESGEGGEVAQVV